VKFIDAIYSAHRYVSGKADDIMILNDIDGNLLAFDKNANLIGKDLNDKYYALNDFDECKEGAFVGKLTLIKKEKDGGLYLAFHIYFYDKGENFSAYLWEIEGPGFYCSRFKGKIAKYNFDGYEIERNAYDAWRLFNGK